jgi:hypothetical protein
MVAAKALRPGELAILLQVCGNFGQPAAAATAGSVFAAFLAVGMDDIIRQGMRHGRR